MVVEPMSNPIRRTVGVLSAPDATGCAAGPVVAEEADLREMETGSGTDMLHLGARLRRPPVSRRRCGLDPTVSRGTISLNGVEMTVRPALRRLDFLAQ